MTAPEPKPGFEGVYASWFKEVVRWIRALGAPEAELEDLTQEVFLVVRRRLPEFDGRNMAGWLYRIAELTVRDNRRRAWFRRLVTGLPAEERPAVEASHPERTLEERERWRLTQGLLARMNRKNAATLVLFEIEGYSGEEIARMQNVTPSTVWARLHHARREFMALVRDAERRGR